MTIEDVRADIAQLRRRADRAQATLEAAADDRDAFPFVDFRDCVEEALNCGLMADLMEQILDGGL